MSHGKKRQKRLGELLEVPSSILKMDLSAAIEGLEYGPNGNKVYITTEEESFENPDGTFTTFTCQWKNHVHYQDMGQGQHQKVLLVRYPVRMENVEEWSRRARMREAATEYRQSKMREAAAIADKDVISAGHPHRE